MVEIFVSCQLGGQLLVGRRGSIQRGPAILIAMQVQSTIIAGGGGQKSTNRSSHCMRASPHITAFPDEFGFHFQLHF